MNTVEIFSAKDVTIVRLTALQIMMFSCVENPRVTGSIPVPATKYCYKLISSLTHPMYAFTSYISCVQYTH